MYTPNRSQGLFETSRSSDSSRKLQTYEPEPKQMLSFPGIFDGYPQIYGSRGIEYTQNFIPGEYEPSEEFPSLSTSRPPGFMSEDFYPPPGFSKPLKTKAPNPNAVSFIPSYLAAPPQKDEKEENELKEYGIRGILNLQKNLQDDKAALAKGKDLSSFDLGKKSSESVTAHLNSVIGPSELRGDESPEFSLPQCYYISKPILKVKLIKSVHAEVLFYAFYNMPGELVQAYVAQELYNREWLYDYNKKQWFTSSGGEWKTFDVKLFKVIPSQPHSGPFLTKDDVTVKQR